MSQIAHSSAHARTVERLGSDPLVTRGRVQLTMWVRKLLLFWYFWWARQDSNLRPKDYESDAGFTAFSRLVRGLALRRCSKYRVPSSSSLVLTY